MYLYKLSFEWSTYLLDSLTASTCSGGFLSNRSGISGSDEELRRSRLAQEPRAVNVSLQDDDEEIEATDWRPLEG